MYEAVQQLIDRRIDLSVPVTAAPASIDLSEVFREHASRLVQSLTLSCGDAQVAADAVQEAFARAHVRWAKISRYDDPVGWIRRIAVNLTTDEARNRTRRRGILERWRGRPQLVTLPPEPPSGLVDSLGLLPQQQRTAICLFYLDDLSVIEVATAMGISEGAVKYHLHQGRGRLRSVLGAI